jgi:hypothetical protein
MDVNEIDQSTKTRTQFKGGLGHFTDFGAYMQNAGKKRQYSMTRYGLLASFWQQQFTRKSERTKIEADEESDSLNKTNGSFSLTTYSFSLAFGLIF